MKITNQSFPHPVLGIQDDVLGKFEADLNWSCDRAFYYLFPVFNLQNHAIEKLINGSSAAFVVHVECANTFFRKSFLFTDKTPEIKINSEKLRDKVDISFYISTVKQVTNYENTEVHEDYNGQIFHLEKGDILAYGGDTTFQAVKNYESLKAVSSIMIIKKGDTSLTRVNFNNDKIELWLDKVNFQIYNSNKNIEHFRNLFHACLVLPILYKALGYIAEDDSDFMNFKWFNVLKTRIDDENLSVEDDEKHFEVIQKLFGNPIDRLFSSINSLNEALYGNE